MHAEPPFSFSHLLCHRPPSALSFSLLPPESPSAFSSRARCIRMHWMHRTPRVMHDARPSSLLPFPPPSAALSTPIRGWRGAKRIVRIFRRPSECREASARVFFVLFTRLRASPVPPLPSYFSLLIILPSLLRTLHRLHRSAASLHSRHHRPRIPTKSTKCKPLAPFPTTSSLQSRPTSSSGGLTC